MARPRRALVESVAIVLSPRCLRFPPMPNLADPSRPWRLARWSAGQVRFQVALASDGVPVSLTIPRQPVSIDPLRWLPQQTIPLTSDFISHRAGLHRRPWFRCPRRQCRRRCARLYLPDGQDLFACRHCYRLLYSSTLAQRRQLTAAARAALPPTSPSLIAALPLWYRWHTEGKGRKKFWRGGAINDTGRGLTPVPRALSI